MSNQNSGKCRLKCRNQVKTLRKIYYCKVIEIDSNKELKFLSSWKIPNQKDTPK